MQEENYPYEATQYENHIYPQVYDPTNTEKLPDVKLMSWFLHEKSGWSYRRIAKLFSANIHFTSVEKYCKEIVKET